MDGVLLASKRAGEILTYETQVSRKAQVLSINNGNNSVTVGILGGWVSKSDNQLAMEYRSSSLSGKDVETSSLLSVDGAKTELEWCNESMASKSTQAKGTFSLGYACSITFGLKISWGEILPWIKQMLVVMQAGGIENSLVLFGSSLIVTLGSTSLLKRHNDYGYTRTWFLDVSLLGAVVQGQHMRHAMSNGFLLDDVSCVHMTHGQDMICFRVGPTILLGSSSICSSYSFSETVNRMKAVCCTFNAIRSTFDISQPFVRFHQSFVEAFTLFVEAISSLVGLCTSFAADWREEFLSSAYPSWGFFRAILDFLKKFTDAVSTDLQFVIDDITSEDDSAVGLTWHLEWRGKPFPFSKGCSFYRSEIFNGKRQIVYARDSVEPVTKPGDMAWVAIKAVNSLLERFPQLADRF
eukprot:Gb_31950 [translate_table: standard]